MKTLEESGLGKPVIERVLKSVGQTQEDTVVIVDGETFLVTGQQVVENTDTPPCATEKCQELKTLVEESCKNNGWSPGHSVLVCDASGTCCYCYCS